MKKIINGKTYNTDTAKYIGEYDNQYHCTDFNYCYEALFLKRTGEYFLYGFGGARTKYASLDGDFQCCGEEIIPITEEEALEWAAAYLPGSTYREAFGTRRPRRELNYWKQFIND